MSRDFVFRSACFSTKEEAQRLKIGSMVSLSVADDCSMRILLWRSWIFPGGAGEAVVVDSFQHSRLWNTIQAANIPWYNIPSGASIVPISLKKNSGETVRMWPMLRYIAGP